MAGDGAGRRASRLVIRSRMGDAIHAGPSRESHAIRAGDVK